MILGGTAHYARDRSTFTRYHPAKCHVGSMFGPLRVLGIGTVTLEMVRGPNDPRTYTLTLDDVLHVPTVPCNGVSLSPDFTDERNLAVIYHEITEAFDADSREPVFYADRLHGLYRAVLAGEPQGVSYLGGAGGYMLSVYVSDEDMEMVRNLAASAS